MNNFITSQITLFHKSFHFRSILKQLSGSKLERLSKARVNCKYTTSARMGCYLRATYIVYSRRKVSILSRKKCLACKTQYSVSKRPKGLWKLHVLRSQTSTFSYYSPIVYVISSNNQFDNIGINESTLIP